MKVWVITHKVPGYDSRVCSVHGSLDSAKVEAERLDNASSWASTIIVEREFDPGDQRWSA